MAKIHHLKRIHVINDEEYMELKRTFRWIKRRLSCCCIWNKYEKLENDIELDVYDLDDIYYDEIYKK